jgi:putative (di)nucleoside polyphosphate hydrolase
MDITCGSFIIDVNNNILLCRTTGTPNDWTVPKGLLEDGETPSKAAKRELLEETGIDIMMYPHTMTELGIAPYNHKKKMIIGFMFKLEGFVKQKLFCISMFTNILTGGLLPEVDKYVWVPLNIALNFMRPEQIKLIREYVNNNV